LFDIADMCEKYMKLYNIIEGTRANFTNDRQLIDRICYKDIFQLRNSAV